MADHGRRRFMRGCSLSDAGTGGFLVLKRLLRIRLRFIKYDIHTGYIFKICRNFTYEVMGQRRRLKAVKTKFTSKIKCQFIF
jgi:hypothetical protein